ncbi:MAG: hypothetical protein CSA52_02185 [Gammaproteobacteria bacterium]|nr:MAG: hypothetical protein CSB48_06170 [Pseudomonadota bacterium]PIE38402.1 MAG: hypothetical protein CSA52_02185 [Gammaproteobacteria bacterium]
MSRVQVFNAKSITFNYDRIADRICLALGDAKSEVFHHAWITRRYLQELLPRMASWMDASCPLIEENKIPLTTEQKTKVASFEHNSARKQVKTQKGPPPENQARKIDKSYLLSGLQLSHQTDLITLVFIDVQNRPVSGMKISRNELHKLASCLLDLANRVGWNIRSPWEPADTVTISSDASVARH